MEGILAVLTKEVMKGKYHEFALHNQDQAGVRLADKDIKAWVGMQEEQHQEKILTSGGNPLRLGNPALSHAFVMTHILPNASVTSLILHKVHHCPLWPFLLLFAPSH